MLALSGLRVLFFLFSVIISLPGYSQPSFRDDTIRISAVTVTAPYLAGQVPFSERKIDSVALDRFSGVDLASLLAAYTNLNIKRYGNSGLASVSFRGLSGSHTAVLWNGININDANTGQVDLAIIPVISAGGISITPGGSDLRDVTGSLGGKIELVSENFLDRGSEINLFMSQGSFSNYSSSLTIKTGSNRIAGNFSLWGNTAINDYYYINLNSPSGPEKEKRTNASAKGWGATADISLPLGGSALSGHLWINSTDRQLPGPVTTLQQDYGETQSDNAIRAVLNYRFRPGILRGSITAGGVLSDNKYNNEAYNSRGDNRTAMMTIRMKLATYAGKKTELSLNTGDELQYASSLSFTDKVTRNIFAATATGLYKISGNLTLMSQLRQSVVDDIVMTPEATAGGTFFLGRAGDNRVKFTVSRNVKLPSLNDMYWQPGGNPELRHETSWGGETGWSGKFMLNDSLSLHAELNAYVSRVTDLIQWVPLNATIWTAENVRNARVQGLEALYTLECQMSKGKLVLAGDYSLTISKGYSGDSGDRTNGKQLIYTPLHNASSQIQVYHGLFRGGVSANWESRRFIVADNSEWIKGQLTMDADAGLDISLSRYLLSVDLKILNILNARLESTKNFPMPLRSYALNIRINYNNLKNSKER